MPSLQLTDRGRGLLASRRSVGLGSLTTRRTLAVVSDAVLAEANHGGEASALSANRDGAGAGLAAAKQKRSGLKSLHLLAAILLKKLGPGYLLGLVLTANMVYYKISHVDARISNPEKRIASYVPKFSSELSELVQDDLAAVTEGLIYTWRLCSYASPKYLCWIMAYVLVAGGVIRNFSPASGNLKSTEQQLEGDYRQLHSRLRTHAESVAFYSGENRESSHIMQRI